MNYYEHHIGDYDANTAHLSWTEDAAYTRLMRLYYRREQPIPIDLKEACRLVRATTREQRAAVELVLKEFFRPEADGWHQDRCDGEIDKYQRRVAHNRAVGRLGGRPGKTASGADPTRNPPGSDSGNPSGSSRVSKKNPPQSPDTSYSEAQASGADAPPAAAKKSRPRNTDPVKQEIWDTGMRLLWDGEPGTRDKAAGFLTKLVREYGQPATLDAVRAGAEALGRGELFEAEGYRQACCLRATGRRRTPVANTQGARAAAAFADLDQIERELRGQIHARQNNAAGDFIDVPGRVVG